MTDPCDKLLTRRMRDICRGFDDAGNPVVLRPGSREKYLQLWGFTEEERKELLAGSPTFQLPDQLWLTCAAWPETVTTLKRQDDRWYGRVPGTGHPLELRLEGKTVHLTLAEPVRKHIRKTTFTQTPYHETPPLAAFPADNGYIIELHPHQPDTPPPPAMPQGGPGTELKAIFAAKGFPACQQCSDLARRMDLWGVDGCRERLDEIVAEILPRAKTWLKAKHSWAQAWLGAVGVEDAALSLAIRQHVLAAIQSAETRR